MIRNHVITEDEKELYKYAVCSLILSVSPLFLAGMIGFCLGSVKNGVILIIPFMILRKTSGGYHAGNLNTCIGGSSIVLYLFILSSMHASCDWKLAIATFCASVSLIIFSPIESINRKLDADEKKTYKRITVLCVILFGLINTTLFLSGEYIYLIGFSYGIILTAILQIPCMIKKYRKRP